MLVWTTVNIGCILAVKEPVFARPTLRTAGALVCPWWNIETRELWNVVDTSKVV